MPTFVCNCISLLQFEIASKQPKVKCTSNFMISTQTILQRKKYQTHFLFPNLIKATLWGSYKEQKNQESLLVYALHKIRSPVQSTIRVKFDGISNSRIEFARSVDGPNVEALSPPLVLGELP